MKSICVFGDSLAKGVVLDSLKNRYTFLKDSFMSLVAQTTGISVSNYSKFGCDIVKGSDILLKHADELSKYDYTFIEFGGNDCNFDWKSISERPDDEHQPLIPLDRFKSCYDKLIKEVRAFHANPVMLTLPPLDAQRFFDWVSKGNNPNNILKWLGDVDHIFRWHRDYNDAVCEIAHENNVPLLDIRSTFTSMDDYTPYVCEDGMHYNSKGHKIIARQITDFCLA